MSINPLNSRLIPIRSSAFLFVAFIFLIGSFGMAQEIRTLNGSGTFTVPDKITSVDVTVWGGGGGGGYNPAENNRGAGGGGGGGFSQAINFDVTPFLGTVPFSVGLGGNGGSSSGAAAQNGGQSFFGSVIANGGFGVNPTNVTNLRLGAAGGNASGGTTNSTGGSGGSSGNSNNNNNTAGGGGGAAANISNGQNGSNNPSNTVGGAGGIGAGVGIFQSGSGGNGGNTGSSGVNGTAPGGGGGGEGGNGSNGGRGGDGRIIVSWNCFSDLTSAAGTDNQSVCINTPITNITYELRGAFGATITGLPDGLSFSYVAGDITISGVPTVAGVFNYTITPVDACADLSITGSITVSPNNTFGGITNEVFCEGESLPVGTVQPTSGATELGTPTGLPSGVNVELISNEIVFSGTPTEAGIFDYSIPLLGGCGNFEATGTLTINAIARIEDPVLDAQTSCEGVPFSPLSIRPGQGYTYQWFVNSVPSNTGGTLIDGATGFEFIPPNDVLGEFYYYVEVTSACSSSATSNVSGVITVVPAYTVTPGTLTVICINNPIPNITHITTEATGIGTPIGLPPGVNAVFDPATETITISGTPTFPGNFNYSIPLVGGCGVQTATGTIRVNAEPVVLGQFTPAQETCLGTPFPAIRVGSFPGLLYQWFVNTVPDNTTGTEIPGATSPTFTPPSNVVGTRYYYVRVRSVCVPGEVFSPISGPQTVNPLPVVSFVTQPSGPICVDEVVSYSTQPGQSNYVWSLPGVAGTDYVITAGGLNTDNTVSVRWLTPGNKVVSINYANASGCSAAAPVPSNPLTVRRNTFSPSIPLNPSVCVNTALAPVTINTTLATGIGTPSGLPPGVTASFSGNVITLSGTPTAPGIYNYSIPLTGGCGTVSATGTIEVTPVYQLITTTSVSASTVGGSARITIRGNTATLPNGVYTVQYLMGGDNPGGPFTTTVTVSNGRGVFNTVPINNAGATSLTIQSLRRQNDSCTIPISQNNLTFFGICAEPYEESGFFYVPAGITEITVRVWGGGGKGGNATTATAGGGGGGGGFSTITVPVSPGQILRVVVGAGGTATNPNGSPSLVTRNPTDDLATSIIFANGGSAGTIGGFGNGGTGNSLNGQNGLPNTGSTAGGNGGQGGGNGGLGGAGGTSTVPITAGTRPGGGGGGAVGNGNIGSNGGNGLVIISYSCPPISPTGCFEVIDDGSRTGNTIIRFTCEENEWLVPPGLTEFTAVAIGGGGGGGSGNGGTGSVAGGGGAGGLVSASFATANPAGMPDGTSFQINAGRGGAGAANANERGANGAVSTLSGILDGNPVSLSAPGGGGGGSFNASAGIRNGNNGASGGGGSYYRPTDSAGLPGVGQAGLGHSGAVGIRGNQASAGGGGGGANGIGLEGTANGNGNARGGAGGPGRLQTFFGFGISYGAGGGGIGGLSNDNTPGLGGQVQNSLNPSELIRIGGNGNVTGAGFEGTPATGSGGGAGNTGGGRGGSGVVYIIYQNFNILPVEYIFINAEYQAEGRMVDVTWATAKEWENSHFEVQRSYRNVNNWMAIGRVEGQGYSDGPVFYKFEDKELPLTGGRVFYRLKQVDFSGKFDYSKVLGVTVPSLQFTSGVWRAFPNPTDGTRLRVSLMDRTQYDGEELTFRLVHPFIFTQPKKVANELEMNAELDDLLKRMPKGVFVVEIQWGQKVEHIKVLRQ